MNQQLDELLQSCTVKLTVPGKSGWGTGFFVAQGLILTCVHVIEAAGFGSIKVSWQNQENIAEASTEVYLPEFDLALLRLKSVIKDQPCVYLDEEFQPYDCFYTYGYPDNFPKGASVTSQCDGSAKDNKGLPLILFSKGRIRPGLSGSPLLNKRTSKVCGIVKFTHDRGSDLGGGAVPTEIILTKINSLIEGQKEFHRGDARWTNFCKRTVQESLQDFSYCNLPVRDYSEFIGRRDDLNKLLEFISLDHRMPIISVDGIGGVGKTTLVLEAAYLCWQAKKTKSPWDAPIFDAIIFTTAKDRELRPSGIVIRPQREATLDDMFRIIARTLDDSSIIQAAPEEQRNRVYASLGRQKTLLIIDNMETIQDEEGVLSFLDYLPNNAKAVITSRKRLVRHACINLESLPRADSIQLILKQAEEKGVRLNKKQANLLYSHLGGIPIALIYAVGRLSMSHSLERLLKPLMQSTSVPTDIGRFCFERSVKSLNKPAYNLLISLVIFRGAPIKEALGRVAGLQAEPIAVDEGLAQLQQLSLVSEKQNRYRMLTLTREYTLAELAAHPEFEKAARERWIQWYLEFANKYGGEDWEDWCIKYDHLDDEINNIRGVIEWCSVQERYADIKHLWQSIDNYIDLYSYWQDRLYWLQWLVRESNRRPAELSTYVEAMSEQGWTLTLMGGKRQVEAANKLVKAWKQRIYADLNTQAHIANHIAVLRMTQEKYKQALRWLKREQEILNKAHLGENSRIRHQMHIDYYQAEISFHQGNYAQAGQLFQQVVEQGENIGWQRFSNYAQNWLGDIAIIQDDLPRAEELLKQGLIVAERNKEKRRIAHYQASLARLETARSNLRKAHEYAIKALDIFKREGIAKDAAEMRGLRDSLELSHSSAIAVLNSTG